MTISAGLQGDAIPAAVDRIRRFHRLFNSLNNWPNTFGTLTYHQRWAEFEKNPCLPNADVLLAEAPELQPLFEQDAAPVAALAMMLTEPRLVADVVLALLDDSVAVGKALDARIAPGGEREIHQRRFAIGCEVVFFHLHMLGRTAVTARGGGLDAVCRQAEIHLPRIWLEMFIGHWPEERQADVGMEFRNNLSRAQDEYGRCLDVFRETDPLATDAVLSRFAWNAADAAGCVLDEHHVGAMLVTIAQFEWPSARLGRLIGVSVNPAAAGAPPIHRAISEANLDAVASLVAEDASSSSPAMNWGGHPYTESLPKGTRPGRFTGQSLSSSLLRGQTSTPGTKFGRLRFTLSQPTAASPHTRLPSCSWLAVRI